MKRFTSDRGDGQSGKFSVFLDLMQDVITRLTGADGQFFEISSFRLETIGKKRLKIRFGNGAIKPYIYRLFP